MNIFLRLLAACLIYIFSQSAGQAQCNYSIVLYDTFGDGWDIGSVSLVVGSTPHGPYTIVSGGGPETYNFLVNPGDPIVVTYTPSQWPAENSYFIYDSDGNEIFSDGPSPTADGTLVGNGVCPTCSAPFGLNATNISSTSVTLGWTEPGSATLWNIQYGPDGFTIGSGTTVSGVSTNPYNLSGLTSSTAYDFYVQSDCGSGDLSSWTGPYSFLTTACLLSQQCNYIMDMHDYGNSWNGGGITVMQDGVSMGFFTVFSGGQNHDTVTLCNGSNIQLVWTSGAFDNECSFNMLDPYGSTVFSFAMGGAPEPGAFHAFVSYCTPPTCPAPANLSVSNISDVSATINWTESGTATSWDIEYGNNGFVHGSGILVPGVTIHPHGLTGLSPLTEYDFYVRAICGAGDTSIWSGPFSFTTFLGTIPNPSSCGLEIPIPDGGCINIPIQVTGVYGSQMGTDVLLTDARFIIRHTWDQDINATLISPNGVQVVLTNGNGGGDDNYGMIDGTCTNYTNFNMAGPDGLINAGVAPFIGSYVPQGNMASFNDNTSPNGNWILRLCDAMMADTGSLQFVELVFEPILPPATIVINEVDCDQAVNDTLEFVELFDGGIGNYPLDGYTVVFYNGSNDQCYASFDLDGYSTSPSGYFVIGNADVPGVNIIFADNLMHNGTDAIALYTAEGTSFPVGTALTLTNLVDALVYATDDPYDLPLLTLLNTGQPQINENAALNKDIVSMSRIPNGSGGTRNTLTYKPAPPTPNAINRPLPELIWNGNTFTEALMNDGSIGNGINLLLNDLTFAAPGIMTQGVHYTTSNVPAGLSLVITVLNDTAASVTLTGNAVSHLNINDVSNLTITFLNAAYNGLSSIYVIGNSKNNLVVDFFDNTPPTLTWDVLSFSEATANDGSIADSIHVRLYTDTFTISSGLFTPVTHFASSNVPAGLTVQIEATSDSTAVITLQGNATNHISADNISNLGIVFTDDAFEGGSASAVNGYSQNAIAVNYLDPYPVDLTIGLIPEDTIYICNNCSCNSPDIIVYNNGPGMIYPGDTILVYYQHAPMTSPEIDTIVVTVPFLSGDSLILEPSLTITQNGIYSFDSWVYFSSDSDPVNDTANAVINAYQLMVDLGGTNDTIHVTGYPYTLDAGPCPGPLSCTYSWSGGSIGQTLIVNSDGWYYVTLTDAIGCTASDSVYVVFISNFTDLAIHIIPSDTIFICNSCSCDYPQIWIINTGLTTIPASENIPVFYQYSPLPMPVEDTLTLTTDLLPGDSVQFILPMNITVSGIYNLLAFVDYVPDMVGSNDFAVVPINAYQLSIDLGGVNDTLVVGGYPYALAANPVTGPFTCNYVWSDGSSTQIINVLSDGWYAVTVTDLHGCSASDSVYIFESTTIIDLTVEIVPDTFITCSGLPDILIINSGPAAILTGDTIFVYYQYPSLGGPVGDSIALATDFASGDTLIYTPLLNITQAGIYTFTSWIFHADDYFSSNDTATTVLNAYLLSVNLGGINDTLIAVDFPIQIDAGVCSGPFTCNFIWSNDSTTQVITAYSNGWYGVTVSDTYGCFSSDSVFAWDPDGIDENLSLNGINVYPNPVRDVVYIEVQLPQSGEINCELYSIRGQLLKQQRHYGISKATESIDVSDIPAGIYYLKISAGEKAQYMKLVVQ